MKSRPLISSSGGSSSSPMTCKSGRSINRAATRPPQNPATPVTSTTRLSAISFLLHLPSADGRCGRKNSRLMAPAAAAIQPHFFPERFGARTPLDMAGIVASRAEADRPVLVGRVDLDHVAADAESAA